MHAMRRRDKRLINWLKETYPRLDHHHTIRRQTAYLSHSGPQDCSPIFSILEYLARRSVWTARHYSQDARSPFHVLLSDVLTKSTEVSLAVCRGLNRGPAKEEQYAGEGGEEEEVSMWAVCGRVLWTLYALT